MKTLRDRIARFGRAEPSTADFSELTDRDGWLWPRSIAPAVASGDAADVVRRWNTLSTLGAGPVADIDQGGCIFLRNRPMAVDVWIGGGDRWWYPATEATVRQTRIEGLPIVETRTKVGDADVVHTAWADEGGDGRGRVVVQLSTELEVPVVVAIVLRPLTLTGPGRIGSARISGRLLIADRRPVVRLPRDPGDTAVGSSALGDITVRLGDQLIGETDVEIADGSATIAAMIPLAPGIDQIVQIIDGRDEADEPPAELTQVVSGWKSHLDRGASIQLPGWPKHVPLSLTSGLLGAAARSDAPGSTAPLGDDALVAGALARTGFGWAAATVLDRLFDAMVEGKLERSSWIGIAAATTALVDCCPDDLGVVRAHEEMVVAAIGHALEAGTLDPRAAVDAIAVAAGRRAADDARSIPTSTADLENLLPWAVLDAVSPAADWSGVHAHSEAVTGVRDAQQIGLAMVSGARGGDDIDAVLAARSVAGSTWRWASGIDGPGQDRGTGDSAHSRAALLLGLRAQAIRETADGIDVLPGFAESWLGRTVDVGSLPTRFGALSFALRWHGARPALLWELDPREGIDALPVLTAAVVDPTFRTRDVSGEMLLDVPEAGRNRLADEGQ